jgi:uncharacterized protein (TIGR03437 family)
MTSQKKLSLAKLAVVFGVIPILLLANAFGPPAGKSGVPGESTCAESGCHVGTLNSGPGSVTVTFPNGQSYTPGVKQHLTVTISDPNQRRWGFELTARESRNTRTQAGTFASTDRFTGVLCASTNLLVENPRDFGGAQNCPASQPLIYIEHSEAGAARTVAGSLAYEFDWTPPATDVGNITIYVAGNAANGDGNNTGDRIYTRNYVLTPSAGGGGSKPAITSGEVRNPSDLPGSGITGGGYVQIKGANLANIGADGRIWKTSDFDGNKLPTSLDGTSVTINGKPAYVYFISPTQVNVIAPVDSAQGPVQVVVTNNGQASDPVSVNLQPFAPAFFMYNGTWAVATRNSDGAIIGDPARVPGTVPAKPGDVLLIWGTGFGPTSPAFPDGSVPAGVLTATTVPSVTIGGVAPSFVNAVINGFAGVYQVGVVVPNVPDGDQKVVATSGGFASRSDVTIYVKR